MTLAGEKNTFPVPCSGPSSWKSLKANLVLGEIFLSEESRVRPFLATKGHFMRNLSRAILGHRGSLFNATETSNTTATLKAGA